MIKIRLASREKRPDQTGTQKLFDQTVTQKIQLENKLKLHTFSAVWSKRKNVKKSPVSQRSKKHFE